MISFATADRLHQLGQRCALGYHQVEYFPFRRFCQWTRHLLRLLAESTTDEEWLDVARALRRYRFDLSAAPIAFDEPSVAPRLGPAVLQQRIDVAKLAYPGLAARLGATVDALLDLCQRHDNPLLDCIEAVIARGDTDTTALVVADSRLVAPSRLTLAARPTTRGLDVLAAAGIRGSTNHDRFILIGPTRWFPDHVFSAPRVDTIEVIAYAWQNTRWRPAPTFLAPYIGAPRPLPMPTDDSGPEGEDDLDDVGPGLDWAALERQWAGTSAESDEAIAHDLIEARLYALDGGQAVFLDATGRETTLVIDLEVDERARVRQVAEREITAGMFVMLRTDEHGDYVIPVADHLLGDRRDSYRAAQARWKARLRDHARHHGLTETCIQLLDLGAERADEGNLRFWMSARNIGTRDERDFVAIMKLVGLEDEANRYWQITRVLRRAHSRAGALIRKRLVARVREADPAVLEHQGRIDFELPEAGGGRLSAFRVEGRSATTVLVPAARVERPFAWED